MLPVQFLGLTMGGMWCPVDWTSNWAIIAYKIYSYVVSMLMYFVGISQIARLIFIKMNYAEFNSTLFLLLSTNCACFKATCNLCIRKRMIKLINMFKEDCCIARSAEEIDIQKKYDYTCRLVHR